MLVLGADWLRGVWVFFFNSHLNYLMLSWLTLDSMTRKQRMSAPHSSISCIVRFFFPHLIHIIHITKPLIGSQLCTLKLQTQQADSKTCLSTWNKLVCVRPFNLSFWGLLGARPAGEDSQSILPHYSALTTTTQLSMHCILINLTRKAIV